MTPPPSPGSGGRRSEAFKAAVLGLLLLAAGSFAWQRQLQGALEVDASALGTLPLAIGAWRGQDIPLDQNVEAILRADSNVSRRYRHPIGETLWLYLGYYGTDRGGRPEHLPETCYPAAGWAIEEQRRLDPGSGTRVNEYVVRQGGESRLVHFWYRTHRSTGIVGQLGLRLDHAWGRLGGRRADGALVRISTPLEGSDLVPARGRLAGFAAELEPLLAGRWPLERASAGPAGAG